MTANVGTSIHGIFTGIVAYADDVILMSSSLSGLQKLLDLCVDYYNCTAITLNVDKTEFLASGLSSENSYIELYHHHIKTSNKLKHLGFIWNKKRNCGTLSDINVQERINKFWSVIFALIKGGIRFSQPATIVELYKTLAIPTLTYGLELPHLTDTQLSHIDKEGRKALKCLFNLSIYSKNYLNAIFKIDHISNIILNNKLKLISRLMANEQTKGLVLSSLQATGPDSSFAKECYRLAFHHSINFLDILLNNNYHKIETVHAEVPEKDRIEVCLNFWHIGEQRQVFRNILEENVVRRHATQ